MSEVTFSEVIVWGDKRRDSPMQLVWTISHLRIRKKLITNFILQICIKNINM